MQRRVRSGLTMLIAGRGRGRQVVSVAKTADLIILMSASIQTPRTYRHTDDAVDATRPLEQKRLLEIELEAVGIRLNTSPPDVVFKQKTAGGVSSASVRHKSG
jgi:uncharacterized protein